MTEKEMESQCKYPGCGLVYKSIHNVKVKRELNAICEVPFCWYHYYIAAGNHFYVNLLDGADYELKGPFDQISLMESFMAAKLMTEKIREEQFKKGG